MRAFVQQPVIPNYRVLFFNTLAQSKEFELEVHASKSIYGMPASADESLYEFNFTEHECEMKLGNSIYYQKNLTLSSNYGEGDILVYNSNPRFLSNNKLVSEAKKRKMRVIAWNHANSATSKGLTSWIRKKITASKADDLLLYTEDEVETMENEGWSKSNLYYLNNTIDERQINKEIKSYTGAEEFLDAKKSDKVVDFKNKNGLNNAINLLFCGRITEKANFDILNKALSHTQGKFNLIVIGDGGFKEKYIKAFEHQGHSVKWLGAIYEENELAKWFLACDAFIYPGAIGLSLNHAMAYGLPVITHNLKSKQMPEISYLKDGFNGWKYIYEDEKSLSNILSNIQSKPLDNIQLNAFKTIHEEFTFDKMVQNFINCLKSGVK